MTTSSSLPPPTAAPVRYYILVWAAEREAPLYACPSHTLSSSSSTSSDTLTPSINAVALYRLFASLALLSAASPEEDGAPRLSHVSLISSTVLGGRESGGKTGRPHLPCVFAATPLCCVAVLAAAAEEGNSPTASSDLLKWVAVGVLASLQPAASRVNTATLHAGTPPLRHRGLPHTPLGTHPDLSAQLAHFWEQEKAKASAAAAAMEAYGAREVLADAHSSFSLKSFLEVSRTTSEGSEVAPVAAAVQLYLTRWWVPFVLSAPGSPFQLHLAGYFAVNNGPATAEKVRVALSHPAVALPPLACSPQYAAAIQLLASFCQAHQQRGLLTQEDGSTAVVVLRLNATTALTALDTGAASGGDVRVFQVAVVCDSARIKGSGSGDGNGQRCPSYQVCHVDTARLMRDNWTLWSNQVLREML
ncbi:hypothetical protein ABB37_08971 [Leptomonas pyrrhocoris]|uniref:Uncharacterized protein n=1 Tax=Leptomonas pyrrhocoris TaxID=157538 RepID=A0A0N0DRL2_LEPPY|nr:hypothetical protein ABB37_08971 [Leptomonas pyrrhocoris]KPA74622.1 hypothetical protein ABB37_08971 [Leptomonas pyrrhocoris]|eukprot:XP_015653061.1 hypothetical protein ABB37_08971 [Leptomonas pyrrhocoris]